MSMDPDLAIDGTGGFTDSKTLLITGTEASAYGGTPDPISVAVDGQVQTGFVYEDGHGNWQGSAALHTGINVVTALETVGGQQQASAPVTYDVVTQPPSVAFSADGVATDTARQTLSGTVTSVGGAAAVAGQSLTVSEDGNQIGQAVVGPGGTWSMPVTLPHLGQNLLSATISDAAGNTGYGDATYLYETAPHAVAIANAGGLTNQPIQRITGTATSQDVITLTDNGVVVGSTTTNADGTWWIRAALPTQGANVLQAIDTSPAGNVGTSGTVTDTLDTVPPAVAITSAATTIRAASAVQTLIGTAEIGSTVSVSDDGALPIAATVAADGTWSAQVALHAGPNGLIAQATDAAGNIGLSGTVVDTLDPTPVDPTVASASAVVPAIVPSVVAPPAPHAPAIAITSSGGLTHDPAATVSGQATADSSVTLYDDGNAVGSATAGADGSWALALTLAQGVNILSATDATAAGTVGGNAISTVLDTTPPAVAFGAPPQLGGSVATLSGTASDASGIAGVEIFDGATALGAAQVAGDGSWTFTHDFGQGSYDGLTAVATDAAGNSATSSAPYGIVTGVPGARSVGAVTARDASGAITSVTTTAADGAVGAQTVSNGDGTATATGYENGQALFSIGNDAMTGNGYRENFVFQPTMGHARITDFVVAGGGHDTITLSHGDFDTVAQVLASTTMNHGSAVIHVSPDDTIRLAGITKAQLAQHRADFAFTS